MKQILLIMAALLFPFCISAKTTYTYKIIQTSYVPNNSENYVYPDARNVYAFQVKLSPSPPNGQSEGNFKVKVENGKFSNGTDSLEIHENATFTVVFSDILYQYGIVKITSANPVDTSTVILQKGDTIQRSYAIASLKGQTPNVTLSNSNPSMGNTQSITAKLWSDMEYPGILVNSISLKAGHYEWTIPPGWKAIASGTKTGTFNITAADCKNGISIIPDNFTAGEIKVRAVNAIGDAGSEYITFTMDRGFALTSYPSSITYGDNTTRTFSVSSHTGVTYEWSAPLGWQINGQGNTIEALNLNSVSITPSYCSFGKITVKLKKDGESSSWYEFPTQITNIPDISVSSSTLNQYECLTITLQNIDTNKVQSVDFSNNVSFVSKQGANYTVVALQYGNIDVTASVLLNGCTAPITISKSINVNSSPIHISGPSHFCSSGTFNISSYCTSGLTVQWTVKRSREPSLLEPPDSLITTTTTYNTTSITLYSTIYLPEFIELTAVVKDLSGSVLSTCYYSATSGAISTYLGTMHWSGSQSGETNYLSHGNSMYLDQYSNYLINVVYTDTAGNYMPAPNITYVSYFSDSNNSYYSGYLNLSYSSSSISINTSLPYSPIYDTGFLSVDLQNNCGSGNHAFIIPVEISSYSPSSSQGYVTAYPNPVFDILNVDIDLQEFAKEQSKMSASGSKSMQSDPSFDIRLYDRQGNLLRHTVTKNDKLTFNVSNIPNGIYFLHIYDGLNEKPQIQQIIVNH